MTLDANYVVTSDVDTFFINKDTGLPLSNGTLFFFRDAARNVPKAVYELSGVPPSYTYTSLGSSVTLSNVGTVQDPSGANQVIYYKPYDSSGNLDLYYVVGQDSNGVVQFTREAWPNITGPATPTTSDEPPLNNQISNPTFMNSFLNLGQATTFSVSAAVNQSFPIAPDWNLIVSGSGSVAVQILAQSGSNNIITNPPYVLEITVSTGITSCFLSQFISNNSGLWSSNIASIIYLSGSFLAQNRGAGNGEVKMFYVDSSGDPEVLIVDGTFSSIYTIVSGFPAPMPISSDMNSGPSGGSSIYLSFPANSHVRVSSIQLVPSFSATTIIPYDLNSSNRNEAYQADYYIPNLAIKGTGSILTGWNFPVNPRQFFTSSIASGVNKYIIDQTIGMNPSPASITTNGAFSQPLTLTTTAANQYFGIMQYIDYPDYNAAIPSNLSINVNAYVNIAGAGTTMNIYLCTSGTINPIPILPSVLGTINADGTFTLTFAGASLVPRNGLPNPKATLTTIDSDYGFTGWNATLGMNAIIVTFLCPASGSSITINDISLVPGNIPSRSSVVTPALTLLQCRYFYEQSLFGFPYAPTTSQAAPLYQMRSSFLAGTVTAFPTSFYFPFLAPKRFNNAIVSFFAPSSGGPPAGFVQGIIHNPGGSDSSSTVPVTNWTISNQGIDSLSMYSNNTSSLFSGTGTANSEAFILFQYIVDCRTGIVT